MSQSTDDIFVRAGRPLRIHFDTTRLPDVARDQLARRVESAGGVVVPLPGSSDVLIVDPTDPWVFYDFLKTKRPELRPSVLLGFWIPLCLVSRSLIWIGHPHWENVLVPQERLPYPGTPQGVLIYGSFLAGRTSVQYTAAQESRRPSPSFSNDGLNDTLALSNRESSVSLSQNMTLDLESDEEPLELSHARRLPAAHPTKSVADSAIPPTSVLGSRTNAMLPRSEAAPNPVIPVRPRLSTPVDNVRMLSSAPLPPSPLSRSFVPPASDVGDSNMSLDISPALSRHSTPAEFASSRVAATAESIKEDLSAPKATSPSHEPSNISTIIPVSDGATRPPASVAPLPAHPQAELAPATSVSAPDPPTSAPVASTPTRTTSPLPIASTSTVPADAISISAAPASVIPEPVSQGSAIATSAPAATISTSTTMSIPDALSIDTSTIKHATPAPADDSNPAPRAPVSEISCPSPASDNSDLGAPLPNKDAAPPKESTPLLAVAPSVIVPAQPVVSAPPSALPSASSSLPEGSPLWKGPQDRQQRIPKSERSTPKGTPSRDVQAGLPTPAKPIEQSATPATPASSAAPVPTPKAPQTNPSSSKPSVNVVTSKVPSNGTTAKPNQPSSSTSSSMSTQNASPSRPGFVSPKTIKLRVSGDSSTSSGSGSNGKLATPANGSASTPQSQKTSETAPGSTFLKPKSLKIRLSDDKSSPVLKPILKPSSPKKIILSSSGSTKPTSASQSPAKSSVRTVSPDPDPAPVPPTPTPEQLAMKPKPWTKEEDQFIIDYMNWIFRRDRTASTSDIMKAIASQLPYRPVQAWQNRFRTKEDSIYMQQVPVLFDRLTNRTSSVSVGRTSNNRTTLEILSGTRTRNRKDVDYAMSSSDDDDSDASGVEYGEGRRRRKRVRLDGRRRSSRLG